MSIRRQCVVVLLTAVACLCVSCGTFASSLYEDQQGSTSWIREFLGDAKHAVLSQVRQLSLVHSSHGLAAISMFDGTLRWRRKVEVEWMHVFDSQDRVVTVSGSEIQMWSQRSGQLLWDKGTQADGTFQATCPMHDALVSIHSGNVSCIDAANGELRWSTPVGASAFHPAFCSAMGAEVVVAVQMQEAGHVKFMRVNARTGSVDMSTKLEFEMPVSNRALWLNESLMIFSRDAQNLCTAVPVPHTSFCVPLPLHASGMPALYQSKAGAIVKIPWLAGTQYFAIPSKSRQVFHPLSQPVSAVSEPFQFGGTTAVLALARVESPHSLRLSVINIATGDEIHSSLIQNYPAVHADGTVSQPVQVWPSAQERRLVNSSVRFLMKAEDMSLWYYSGGEWQWGRDEALAEVLEMTVLDVAHTALDLYSSSVHGTGLSTVYADGNGQDMAFMGYGNLTAEYSLSLVRRSLKQNLLNINAVQARRKILIAACRNGMFYALDAGTGQRIWARIIQRGMSLVAMDTYTSINSTSADIQVMLVLSSSSKSLAALLDAQTGEFDHILQIPHQITHVHSLEHGRNDVSGFLMVDAGIPFPESVAVHMFPEYVQLPSEQKTRIWLSDGVSGQVIGYTVIPGAPSAEGTDIVAEHLWSFSMRSRLLEAVPVTQSAQTGHHVKVHGDRSISFRYLSPNMALLVSQAHTDVTSPGLSIAILDTVSGHLLHSQFHPFASGPTAATFYDNVAMVHFLDMRTWRWQVTAMELYDMSTSGPSTWQMFWGAVSGRTPGAAVAGAIDPVLLKVTRSSVFARMGVRTIHPIQTRFGVMPKHVLLATSVNQVYNLDTNVLDADRIRSSRSHPKKQDQSAIMRTLQLGLSTQSFATYDKVIEDLRCMRTAPSQLESTVYLMAWGSDVYFSTVRPSLGFDTLGEDFSFVLLVCAITGMGMAVIMVRHMVQASRSHAKWH